MTWEEGNQKRNFKTRDINEILKNKEGFLDEKEAKLLLYEFLRENTTFAANLIAGVDLFPFQHMAIKSMFETDYFLGVWSRGMSKSFTTGIFAALDAVLNQGVEIGILSKSFRQAKMIFKKIEMRFLITPRHKPVVFFGFHGHFHFFVKSLLFVQIYQFFFQ